MKGNFQSLTPRRQAVSSPAPTSTTISPATSMAKFSIHNMFPKDSCPPGSPSSTTSSKPASPSSSRPSSAGQASLERRGDPTTEQTNGKVKSETDYSGSARATPSPGGTVSSTRASPKSERSEDESTVTSGSPIKVEKPGGGGGTGEAGGGARSENPLAALQMLCDTQKKSPKNRPQTISEANSQMSDPGAMLAFSWACNQAQVSNDSVIKCPFCDTPFISKGAYRHHLSKMHFTKDGGGATPSPVQQGGGGGGGVQGPISLPPNVTTSPSPPPDAKEDETLQSKYHKYAQMAKQLSCHQK